MTEGAFPSDPIVDAPLSVADPEPEDTAKDFPPDPIVDAPPTAPLGAGRVPPYRAGQEPPVIPERQWSFAGTALPDTEAYRMGETIHPLSRAVLQNFDLTSDIDSNRAAIEQIVAKTYPGLNREILSGYPDDRLRSILETPKLRRALALDSATRERLAKNAEEAAILRNEIPLMMAAEGAIATYTRMMLSAEDRTPEAMVKRRRDVGTVEALVEAPIRSSVQAFWGIYGEAESSRLANQATYAGRPSDAFVNAYKEWSLLGDEQLGLAAPLGVAEVIGKLQAGASAAFDAAVTDPEDAAELSRRSVEVFNLATEKIIEASKNYPLPKDVQALIAGLPKVDGLFEQTQTIAYLSANPVATAKWAAITGAESFPGIAAGGAATLLGQPTLGLTLMTMFNATRELAAITDPELIKSIFEKTGIDLGTSAGRAEYARKATPAALAARQESKRFRSSRATVISALSLSGIGIASSLKRTRSMTLNVSRATGVNVLAESLGELFAGRIATGEFNYQEALLEGILGSGPLMTTLQLGVAGRADVLKRAEATKLEEWLRGNEEVRGIIAGIPVEKLDTAASVLADKMAAEGNPDVFLSAENLLRFDQDGDAIGTLGFTREEVEQAAAEGQDVQIDAQTFIRHILGKDGFDSLIRHTTFEEGALTPDEAERSVEEAINIEAALNEKIDSMLGPELTKPVLDKLVEDASAIRSSVAEQLKATGRYDADKSDAFALLTASQFTARAVRIARETGQPVDAAALFEAENLQIVGGQPAATAPTREAAPEGQIAVFDSEGNQQNLEVVARSEAGGVIVRLPSGEEVLLGSKLEVSDPLSSDFVVEGLPNAPRVSDLSDPELAYLEANRLERIAAFEAAGETGQGGYEQAKRDLTAARSELGRRRQQPSSDDNILEQGRIRSVWDTIRGKDSSSSVVTLRHGGPPLEGGKLDLEFTGRANDPTSTSPRETTGVYFSTEGGTQATQFSSTRRGSRVRRLYEARLPAESLSGVVDFMSRVSDLSPEMQQTLADLAAEAGIEIGRGEIAGNLIALIRSELENGTERLVDAGISGHETKSIKEMVIWDQALLDSAELFDVTEGDPIQLRQDAVELFDTPLPVTPTGGKKGTTVLVKDIAAAFNDDHQTKFGRQLFPEESAEDYALVKEMAVDELRMALATENNGLGWYAKDVQDALEMTSRLYPTLLTEDGHREYFLFMAGIFSNGTNPTQAWEMAAGAYDLFLADPNNVIPVERLNADGSPVAMTTFKSKKTGEKITKPAGWGVRGATNNQQLAVLKYIVEQEGSLRAGVDWFLQEHPRAEINRVMIESGGFKAGRYKTVAEKEGDPARGTDILGPKLGNYTASLLGIEVTDEDTTIDKWYTRTYRRWTGRLFEAPLSDEGVADMPNPAGGGIERNTIFRLTGELSREFDIGPEDVQAVLWFFEKRLWANHGATLDEGTNSNGAEALLKKRGVDVNEGSLGEGSSNSGAAAAAGNTPLSEPSDPLTLNQDADSSTSLSGMYNPVVRAVDALPLPEWKVEVTPQFTPAIAEEAASLENEQRLQTIEEDGAFYGDVMEWFKTPAGLRLSALYELKFQDDMGYTDKAARDNATADGAAIWKKLSSTDFGAGVNRKGALKWTAIEEFLTAVPGQKFSKPAVLSFLSKNGLVVEEVIADTEAREGALDWDTNILDADDALVYDEIETRAQEMVDEFNPSADDYVSVRLLDIINNSNSGVGQEAIADIVALHVAESGPRPAKENQNLDLFEDADLNLSRLQGEWNAKLNNLFVENLYTDELVADAARTAAMQDYAESPYILSTVTLPNGYEVEISGGDDVGYSDDTYGSMAFNLLDAQQQVLVSAVEAGLFRDEDDPTTTRHEGYTEGTHTNYIERKLSLPDIEGDFFREDHFGDERNIVAFTRESDRVLDGKRVKSLDELQSDWHQKGRQVGYATGEEGLNLASTDNVVQAAAAFEALPPMSKEAVSAFIEDVTETDATPLPQTETDATPLLQYETKVIFEVVSGQAFQLDRLTGPDTVATPSVDNLLIPVSEFLSELQSLLKKDARLQPFFDRIEEGAKQYKQARAELMGVPAAPFDEDAWIALGVKRALLDAARGGYEGFMFPSSRVLSARYSDRARKMYEIQYDQKMPSIIKKLTGETPRAVDFEGRGYYTIDFTPELIAEINDTGFSMFQDETEGGAAGPRGGFTPSDLITDQDGKPVNLLQIFEKADPTSFLHESGHFWLEQLKADALAVGGGFQQDFKTVTDWWASRPLELREEAVRRAKKKKDKDSVAALQQMTEAQVSAYARSGDLRGEGPSRYLSVAMHEQFARGVENYFATARAPSLALGSIFSQFKVWVGSVYNRFMKLDVQFSPEVTGVVDRMLASDEEITVVEGQYNMAPLLQTAEQAGMTPTQFAAYQKGVAEAGEARRAKQLSKANRDHRRTLTKWWEESEDAMRPEVEQEVAALPVYRLMYAITELGLADGSVLPDGEAVPRMDKAALAEVLEIEGYALADMPRVGSKTLYMEGGEAPAIVAAAFGYEDVVSMIAELTAVAPYADAVAAAVKARMEDRYGTFDSMYEAVDSAHIDKTAQVLAAELQALRTTEPAFKQKFVRQYARERLLDATTGEIRPFKYIQAEKKHADLAGAALKRGDRTEAYKHQFHRLVNHYMSTEALKAQRDVDKKRTYMEGFSKRNKKFPSIEAEYVDVIKSILKSVNFKTGAAGKAERTVEIAALEAFIETRQEQDGALLTVPDFLLDPETNPNNNIRGMSYRRFLQLHEVIKRYDTQGRNAKRARKGEDAVELSRLTAELLTTLAARKDSLVSRFRSKSASEENITGWKGLSFLAAVDGQLLKIEALLEAMDGSVLGPWHQSLYEPFSEAAAQSQELQLVVSDMIGSLVASLPRSVKKNFGKGISPSLLGGLGKPGMRITRGNLVMLALNAGNEGNLDKVIRGLGGDVDTKVTGAGWNINEDILNTAFEQLTEEEWSLIRTVWAHAEKLWPTVDAIYRKEHGLSPDRVEPRTITTKFGDITGGYFPLMYDKTVAGASADAEQKDALQLMQAQAGRASVNSSMTKARTGYAAPVTLNINKLASSFRNTIHFITHYEAVQNANKILNQPEIKAAIEIKVGSAYYRELRAWLAALAVNSNDTTDLGAVGEFFNQIYTNTTVAILGASYTTLGMQTLGIINGQDRILADAGYTPKNTALLQKDMAYGAMKALDGQHARWIMEASGEMRFRRDNIDQNVDEALRSLKGKTSVLPAVQRTAMQAIAQVQFYSVDMPVWTAAYNTSLRSHPNDTPRAVKYADRVIRLSQSAGALKDLSPIQRKAYLKPFLMFYTWFAAWYATQRGLGAEFGANITKRPAAAVARAATRMFVLLALTSVGVGLVRGKLPDWEEEDPETGETRYAMLDFIRKESLSTFTGSIPVLREITSGWASGFGYSGGAGTIAFESVEALLSTVAKEVPQLFSEDEDAEVPDEERVYSDAAEKLSPYIMLLGVILGVPAVQVNRTLGGIANLFDEVEGASPMDVLLGPANEDELRRRLEN